MLCYCAQVFMVVLHLYVITVSGRQESCKQINSTTVDCSHKGLLRIPKTIPSNTTVLVITYNNITVLYDNDFINLTKLVYLDLSFNPISSMQPKSLNGLCSLRRLEMFGHDLNYTKYSLPGNVFEDLQNLEILYLRSDRSRTQHHGHDVPADVIAKLVSLKELSIDTRPKTVFQIGFQHLTQLKKFIIGQVIKHNVKFACGLSYLGNTTFGNIPISLNYVDFFRCQLYIVDFTTFKPLINLKTLLMNYVYLPKQNLTSIFNALAVYENKTMDVIQITNFYGDDQFTGKGYTLSLKILSKICVYELDLSYNDIVIVDFDALVMPPIPLLTRCIKNLRLIRNRITGKISVLNMYLLQSFSELESADFSLQRIFEFNHFIRHTPKMPEIEKHPIGLPFMLPPKLRHLNIAGFPYELGKMVELFIFNGNNLEYFNISYSGIKQLFHHIYGIGNLKVLDLSGNDLGILREDFFDLMPNLTTLRISNAFLDTGFLVAKGKRLLQPLGNLNTLDLSSNDLVRLSSGLFDNLNSLRVLILVNNKLRTIPDILHLVHLNHIHMSYNSLITLEPKVRQMLDTMNTINSNFHVSLYGNTFACTCSSLDFLMWLQETNVNFDGRNYSCMDVNGEMTTTENIYNDFIYFYRTCNSPFWLNIAIGGFSFLTTLLVTTFVAFKNMLTIRLLLIRLLGSNIIPYKKMYEYRYAVGMVFNEENDECRQFVFTQLKEELATKRHLCINLGDAPDQLGHPPIEAISNGIEHSWKIILLITNDFIQSATFMYTLCCCISAISLAAPNRVLLLIDRRANISPGVCNLIESVPDNCTFKVDIQNDIQDDELWNKLYNSILTTPEDFH